MEVCSTTVSFKVSDGVYLAFTYKHDDEEFVIQLADCERDLPEATQFPILGDELQNLGKAMLGFVEMTQKPKAIVNPGPTLMNNLKSPDLDPAKDDLVMLHQIGRFIHNSMPAHCQEGNGQ